MVANRSARGLDGATVELTAFSDNLGFRYATTNATPTSWPARRVLRATALHRVFEGTASGALSRNPGVGFRLEAGRNISSKVALNAMAGAETYSMVGTVPTYGFGLTATDLAGITLAVEARHESAARTAATLAAVQARAQSDVVSVTASRSLKALVHLGSRRERVGRVDRRRSASHRRLGDGPAPVHAALRRLHEPVGAGREQGCATAARLRQPDVGPAVVRRAGPRRELPRIPAEWLDRDRRRPGRLRIRRGACRRPALSRVAPSRRRASAAEILYARGRWEAAFNARYGGAARRRLSERHHSVSAGPTV